MPRDVFQNPLSSRYASPEMLHLFSDDFKYATWRKLWTVLAEVQRELGLPITQTQIAELKRHVHDTNYRIVAKHEKEVRHDVMAHLYAYGLQCPKAKPILHLGATSCTITDNADLVQLSEALLLLEVRLLGVVKTLAGFARTYRALPCLAYTHLQPAQPTTVGKRACLWIQDLLQDFRALEFVRSEMKFLGAKGTTGTQASFLKLFHGSRAKVEALDRKMAKKMGFSETFPVTGQTYPRKLDHLIGSALSGIAQSSAKFALDVRLLQSFGETEEPFEKAQVGSSAMPYKRNPMRCERIGALSRFLMTLAQNPVHTASSQAFERTLDDSANRRLVLPQLFLTADAVLLLYENAASGLVVHKDVISERLRAELPFLASENLLMASVERGADRQILHEKLRRFALSARRTRNPKSLLSAVASDKAFPLGQKEVMDLADAKRFTGRAAEQTELFLKNFVRPLLKKHARRIPKSKLRLKV